MMAPWVFVCSGTKDEPHVPTRMGVDKNGVGIFRLPGETNLILAEGREWMNLARSLDCITFKSLVAHLDLKGGDYYGDGDRMVCPVCGVLITWRV